MTLNNTTVTNAAVANATVANGALAVLVRLTLAASLVSCLSACSLFWSSEEAATIALADGSFTKDGTVSLAGPIPAIQPASAILASAQALGFVPTEAVHDGSWVSIDSKSGMVRLMSGSDEIRSGVAEGAKSLRSGTFQLRHKQRSALWHAPESYFSSRGLSVPSNGAKDRFLRGALGEFSLFIDKTTPIHSGPLWTPELGGLKVDENLLSSMYYSLEVGAPIEIR
jgi:hypothetical protein